MHTYVSRREKLKGEYLKWLLVPVICSMNEREGIVGGVGREVELIYTKLEKAGSFKSNQKPSPHLISFSTQQLSLHTNNSNHLHFRFIIHVVAHN